MRAIEEPQVEITADQTTHIVTIKTSKDTFDIN